MNEDGSRLVEFMEYYEESDGLVPTQRYELGGLILASANGALVRGGHLPKAFMPFLRRNCDDWTAELDYWRDLESKVEFPLSAWLHEHGPF